jgi:meso-butanediol dehydrogenase/(S,S)-butanediol dehydrogenase/diacetyl reductase
MSGQAAPSPTGARRVVVTGGASGIGLATAKRFHQDGATVAIIDLPHQLDALDRAEDWLTIPADVSAHAGVSVAFEAIDDALGGVDVLVANAGISVRCGILEITPQEWERVLATNLNGVFYCAQAAARRMHAGDSGGVILMTASTNGQSGHPHYAHYNASKAGVLLLARTMARELGPRIRVNAVCPGWVWTPMQQAEYTPEMVAAVNAQLPLKRHGSTEDIANLFAFLASSEASYITGTGIPIDGGELA